MKIKIQQKIKNYNYLIIIKKNNIKLAVNRNKIKRRIKNALNIFKIKSNKKTIIFYNIKNEISYQDILQQLQIFTLKFI